MKRRPQRRTGTAVLVGLGAMLGMLVATAPGPAQAASATGTVYTGGTALNVRIGPTTAAAKSSSLPQGTRVTVVCQTQGQKIRGNVRTTNLWDRLPNGGYVSDAYIRRGAVALPRCAGPAQGPAAKPIPVPTTPGAAPGASWVLPVPATVGSHFRTKSRPTHDGVDMGAARFTPIRSVSAGTVIVVVCNASTNNCDVDGGIGVKGCGWYVEVQHAGHVITRYCHMVKRPSVRLGQTVTAGQVLGYVGSSGNSSGPHLHFEVHVNATQANRTNAVDPVLFLRSKGVKML